MKARIVTNGHIYRVETLRNRRFLWKKWEVWRPIYRVRLYPCDPTVAQFYNFDDAKKAMQEFLLQNIPNEWRPVNESEASL